jgi:hypothetical protein
MDGWIDGWIDGWMDGWMDGRCRNAGPHQHLQFKAPDFMSDMDLGVGESSTPPVSPTYKQVSSNHKQYRAIDHLPLIVANFYQDLVVSYVIFWRSSLNQRCSPKDTR